MGQKPTQYSTGFSNASLPLYEELDDAKFEEFCLELLNLHPEILCLREGKVVRRRIVSATKLLSGTAQRGADIRAEAEAGEVWIFQCKHVQRFGASQVDDAVQFAEKGFPHADQFVLVTTCGLREEALRRISSRPKWATPWDSAKLTVEAQMIEPRENGINLVHKFFGPERAKKLFLCGDQLLLTWKEFFAQDLSEQRQHFHHRIPFVPWSDSLALLESFAKSGDGRALVLSAPGGQGKSRLLVELAQNLESDPSGPRVRFLNLSSRGLSADQADFITREPGRLLLIIDDAHRLDGAIEDVAKAAARAPQVGLLVSTRPQARHAVTGQLYRAGYAEDRMDEPLILPRWESEEILKLAETVLQPRFHHKAPRLAGLADRCPLLVVLGGAMVNAGDWPDNMVDEDAFRERVFRGFKEDFLNRQPAEKRERLDRLIRFLSFVSPAKKADALFSKAAEILDCSPLDIGEDIELLQAAGMIVENREGIRLYPDLFADAVLVDAAVGPSGRPSAFAETVLNRLNIGDFPALMRNLAQADWELKVKKDSTSIFEPVWRQFKHRFQEGAWIESDPDYRAWILGERSSAGINPSTHNRFDLLDQWAGFAVYMPDKTLELAELAVGSIQASPVHPQVTIEVRARVCAALPALLKPIATWHPNSADRALDILWSLEATEPTNDFQKSSNGISAIAEVASFGVEKPRAVSETTLNWLERRLGAPTGVQCVRQQPWILAALLSPFFGRSVEHSWASGRTVRFASVPVLLDVTRPLRRKALTIAETFASADDLVLAEAAIPVLGDAIAPMLRTFGAAPADKLNEEWRQDRFEALEVIERAILAHLNAHPLLFQFRRLLLDRDHDPDKKIAKRCEELRAKIPDSLELRVARVITSWAHDEFRVDPGPNFESSLKVAERDWEAICRSVAFDVADHFKTPRAVCDFLRKQLHELAKTKANPTGMGGTLLQPIVEISPEWCVGILAELIEAEDSSLDGFLWPVLQRAVTSAKDAYRVGIETLIEKGRSEQLCSLVNFLGWKHRHRHGLEDFEKHAVIEITNREESRVVYTCAIAAGHHFITEPDWAVEVLTRLTPTDRHGADAILRALSLLAEHREAAVDEAKVARCLANIGGFCFAESVSEVRSLEKIAEKFPIQVYQQIRELQGQAEADSSKRYERQSATAPSLGPIADVGYIDREISILWRGSLASQRGTFGCNYRLALIRSLLGSQGKTAFERIGKLVASCRTGEELRLAMELAAPPGSGFAFQSPELVRAMLLQSDGFGTRRKVAHVLWSSACGGGRHFTEDELDPKHKYILEQGDALANRYKDDPVLGPFYSSFGT